MNRVILTVLVTIIITLVVVMFQPKVPKNIQFADATLGFQQVEKIKQGVDVSIKNINNTSSSDIALKNTDNIKNSNVSVQNIDRGSYMQNIRNRAIEQYKKELAQKKVNQPVTIVTNTNVQPVSVKPTTQNVNKATKSIAPIPVKQKKLTVEEETIAWNQWRANVANAITSKGHEYGVKGVDLGTICKYTFNVDNNLRISSIETSIVKGTKNEYSEKFANAVKSAIKSLDGTAVLKYPEGTERKIVSVVGGIMTSTKSNYIDSSNFNDYEVVKKQYYQ